MSGRPVIYVSGPLTTGDLAYNVLETADAWARLAFMGLSPLAPHLWHADTLRFGLTYAEHMRLDLGLLAKCDALLRLPGPSKGADVEVNAAIEARIPVYYDLAALLADFAGEGRK